jgi:hypothetical protein
MKNPFNELIIKIIASTKVPKSFADLVENDRSFRKVLHGYFIQQKNRDFALKLLEKFIKIRKEPSISLSAESLMLACYILGMHQQTEDCLKIWEAKQADFDTYCGLDIQLMVFNGVEQTLDFLKMQNTETSLKAYEYVLMCNNAGDFNNLEDYFSSQNLPYYIGN